MFLVIVLTNVKKKTITEAASSNVFFNVNMTKTPVQVFELKKLEPVRLLNYFMT